MLVVKVVDIPSVRRFLQFYEIDYSTRKGHIYVINPEQYVLDWLRRISKLHGKTIVIINLGTVDKEYDYKKLLHKL